MEAKNRIIIKMLDSSLTLHFHSNFLDENERQALVTPILFISLHFLLRKHAITFVSNLQPSIVFCAKHSLRNFNTSDDTLVFVCTSLKDPRNDYMQVHTDARQFMTRPVPYFKDLCAICDPTYVEKEFSLPQVLDQQNSVEVKSLGTRENGHSPAVSNYNEHQVRDVRELTDTGHKYKRQSEMCSDSTRPKRSRDGEQGMASVLQEMATAVSSLSTKKSDDNSVAIETVIEAVQALPDMDDDLVLDACDFLEDEKKAKTFLALDVKLRKKWLIRKLRS